MSESDLSSLLTPRSIAVVGASDAPGNLGGSAVRLLNKFGYSGEVWAVHPRGQDVAGRKCFTSAKNLPEAPEMVILAVSAERVADTIREYSEVGARAGVAWAGGFAEVGQEGRARQRRLESVCASTGFKLLGPNCLGVISPDLGLTATFASFLYEVDEMLAGNISMVGQSGGLVTSAMAMANQRGFGFRHAVSTGNEAVLTTADFIEAFATDPGTSVIAVYLEGVRFGERLIPALEAARRADKPVIALKGGSTPASAQAAAAHTGALAVEARVWEAVLAEQCAIQVQSLEELLDMAMTLSGKHGKALAKGPNMAIVTFGGGSGVLSADQCAQAGLAVPELTQHTREALKPQVPEAASTRNPIDLTPETFLKPKWLANFPQALDLIAADEMIDGVLIQFGAQAVKGMEVAEALADFVNRSLKQVVVSWPLAPKPVPEFLKEKRIHAHDEYARGIRVAAHLMRYAERIEARSHDSSVQALDFDWKAHIPPAAAGVVVSEDECHKLLTAVGLPTARGERTHSRDEAVQAAARIGYPVALKAISPEITHRAANGMILLDLSTEQAVGDGFNMISERSAVLGAQLVGVYVERMESPGDEFLVSALRDPTFGIVVTCGAGGVLTELISDVSIECAPFDLNVASRMLKELRVVKRILNRNPNRDLGPLAEFVSRFSRLAASAPWSRFVFEVNPIRLIHERVVAIDGLLIIEEP